MSNLIKSSSTSGPTKKASYTVPLPLLLSPSLLSRFLSYFTPFTFFASTRKIKGKYDEKAQAVIISNREDMEKLWKEGFFGKGSLSRSEPTWFWRNSNKDKGEGKGKQKLAAEQVTEQRRLVRKRNKKGRVQNVGKVQQVVREEAEIVRMQEKEQDEQTIEQTLTQEEENVLLEDIEKLILTTQEAFFLCYGLGILDIYDSQDCLLSVEESWKSFQITSNGFIMKYVVYHYFRSLGWVVRCGMKFGVDYVLYEKGPVFKHAEYAVIILPVHISQNSDNDVDFRNNCMASWSWMMNLNRVCVQVKKSLVLCYVIIPPSIITSPTITECIKEYKVQQVLIKRCIPSKLK